MAWKDTLQAASFRGLIFDVLAESSNHGHALSTHEYPFVDGANVDAMGLKPRHFEFEVIVFGDDFETRLQALLAAFEDRDPAELIHPVYGSIKDCLAQSWKPAHKADEVDQCTLHVEFIETRLLTEFFDRKLPLAKAGRCDAAAANARDEAAEAFRLKLKALQKLLRTPAEITAFANVFDGAMTHLRIAVSGVLTSGSGILTLPSAWIGDVRSIFNQVRNASPLSALLSLFNGATGATDALALGKSYDALSAVAVPIVIASVPGVSNAPGSPYAEAVELARQQLRVEAALVLADSAADLLAQESLNPVMTPVDLAAVANDVRARLQVCIDWYRAHLDHESAHGACEALKETAWAVQDLAKTVIELKPPIIGRAAEGPACLRLLAHQWYGDHERAPELLRFNPRLRLPNFIEQGQTLNAYAV